MAPPVLVSSVPQYFQLGVSLTIGFSWMDRDGLGYSLTWGKGACSISKPVFDI